MRAFGILPSKIKSWEPNKIKNETSCTAPIFVEFGAGRGKLSLALCTVLSQAAHIILVEREGGISKKADSKIRELGRTCQRLRIDIADLDLAAIQILQSTSANQHECLKLSQKNHYFAFLHTYDWHIQAFMWTCYRFGVALCVQLCVSCE